MSGPSWPCYRVNFIVFIL